jgi:mitochondrial import receptor subunit TOM20
LTPRQGRDKKRAEKSAAQSKESFPSSSSAEVTPAALQQALEQVKKEEVPESPQEKEAYFMSHVSMGEQLSAQGICCFFSMHTVRQMLFLGPNFYLAAAMSFYRALRVYPAPVELIVIYQKTVPEPIFKVHSLLPFLGLITDDRVIDGYGYDQLGRKFTPALASWRPKSLR